MSRSIKKWEEEVKKLDEDEAKKLNAALDDLLNWEPFYESYADTGLTVLSVIFRNRSRI